MNSRAANRISLHCTRSPSFQKADSRGKKQEGEIEGAKGRSGDLRESREDCEERAWDPFVSRSSRLHLINASVNRQTRCAENGP